VAAAQIPAPAAPCGGERCKQLRLPLVGDVVLPGSLNHALQHTDVPKPVREVLPEIVDALKSRYGAATS
jgi:hypothetical protein